MEPQFGNLIRAANKLNYTLHPYEHHTSRGNIQERETVQAKKIAKLLDSLPNSKIIVYCGFSHISEDSIKNWGMPMAAKLKELTGIDRYTIEQTVLSERSNTSSNNPYFNLINTKNYAVLTDDAGNAFNKKLDDKRIDAFVYAPPTNYINNRPNWVFENGKRPIFIDKNAVKITYPLLVKVYFKERDIDNLVIPIDIIEIKSSEELSTTAVAVFQDRKFIIELVDTKGTTQIIKP